MRTQLDDYRGSERLGDVERLAMADQGLQDFSIKKNSKKAGREHSEGLGSFFTSAQRSATAQKRWNGNETLKPRWWREVYLGEIPKHGVGRNQDSLASQMRKKGMRGGCLGFYRGKLMSCS